MSHGLLQRAVSLGLVGAFALAFGTVVASAQPYPHRHHYLNHYGPALGYSGANRSQMERNTGD